MNLNEFETASTNNNNVALEEFEDTSVIENNETPIVDVKPKPKRKTKPKTEAIEDIKPEEVKPEEIIPEEIIPEEVKPKPKRKSKPKIEEVKTEEVKPEEIIPEEKPKKEKKIKTIELVNCKQCDKEMTQRTLRYTHPKLCPGQSIDRNEIPVKRRITKKQFNQPHKKII